MVNTPDRKYKGPRSYGWGLISCMEALLKPLTYTIDQHNIRVYHNADDIQYLVLWLSLNAEGQWNVQENLQYFHESSKALKMPYNKLLEQIKEMAIVQWGKLK